MSNIKHILLFWNFNGSATLMVDVINIMPVCVLQGNACLENQSGEVGRLPPLFELASTFTQSLLKPRIQTLKLPFLLGFQQANLGVPVYMEKPTGTKLMRHPYDSKCYLFKLGKTLNDLKHTELNWPVILITS